MQEHALRIFPPLSLILALTILLFAAGCQTIDTATPVEIPTVESPQDSALSKSVRERLIADKKSDLSGISVVSKNGTVYLRGVVKSLEARQQALKTAWSVPGVQSVVNSLDVQR